MRLLVLYQHAPTPGAPGIYRHRLLLAELARRGWTVDLVSSPVNYMHGAAPEPYASHRHLREEIDGVTHHWVRTTDDVHRSMGRRARSYVSFAARARILGARLPRPDVVWASSPPLPVATAGNAIARSRRLPWVLEVRDLWPESGAATGLVPEDGLLYRFLLSQARRFARRANAVIVPTPGLVDLVRGHGATDVTTITGAIVDTPPDPARRAATRERLGVGPDACLFVYVGAHGIVNGLDMVLDAAELLAQREGTRAHVVLAGDGSARAALAERLERNPIAAVQMIGTIPKDEVADLLAAADVGLHCLRPDPVFRSALPTKVLEYLGTHRPFITTVPGLPQEIAAATGGGFAASAEELAAEMAQWVERSPDERRALGDRAHAYGEQHYGLAANADRLEALLRRVVAQGRRGRRGRRAGSVQDAAARDA